MQLLKADHKKYDEKSPQGDFFFTLFFQKLKQDEDLCFYISMNIKTLPLEERPREKLLSCGAAYLSDVELMAVMLGSGIKGKGIFELSDEIVKLIDTQGGRIGLEDMLKVDGLGLAKATTLSASFEFMRRLLLPTAQRIRFPRDILPAVSHYADRPQEYFICISLNGAHEITHTRVVSIGLVNRTMVHPREVFADPIKDRAAAIICAHNHPSGSTEPSKEDREVTEMIKQAGKILGIELLDHIIFSRRGYYSFAEKKEL